MDGGERGSRKVPIIIGLCAVAFLAGFAALVIIDSGQSPSGGSAPDGVETFEVGQAGRHTSEDVAYEQTPPVGGEHNPIWQNAGFYTEPVRNENAVHTMEHGGVWLTYSPDLPQDQRDAIEQIVQGQDCVLASPSPDLPGGAQMFASAWGAQLQVDGPEDPALQDFIGYYQRGPQTPEPGARCNGGVGEPATEN